MSVFTKTLIKREGNLAFLTLSKLLNNMEDIHRICKIFFTGYLSDTSPVSLDISPKALSANH